MLRKEHMWVTFCCADCRVGKRKTSFWAVRFKTEVANFRENSLSGFSYIDISYTVQKKVGWYLWAWEALRCSLQGARDQDCRNVN